jgi:DNA-binding protein H-NS
MTILSSSNTDFAKAFSATQIAAARPTFELNFALLQNALLDQMDVKIEEVLNKDVNRVDAFLQLEQKKLGRALEAVGKFGNETQHNADVLNESLDLVESLVEADENNDDAAFNSIIEKLDELMMESIKDVNGAAAGLNVKDGFYAYRESGSGLSDYADYADDSSRTDAVLDLQNSLLSIFTVMEINRDTAYSVSTEIQSRLTSIDIQVSAESAAVQAEALQEIEDLQLDYGNFLNYLSIAFEVGQSAAQQLSDAIQQQSTTKGTVVDIIS